MIRTARGHKPNHFRNQDKERSGSIRIARRKSFSFFEDDYVIRLMPVGGPQDKENFGSLSIARRKSICFFEDVGQKGVATGQGKLRQLLHRTKKSAAFRGRGVVSLSSSEQGACAFCSYRFLFCFGVGNRIELLLNLCANDFFFYCFR